jgi:hypothetical protein
MRDSLQSLMSLVGCSQAWIEFHACMHVGGWGTADARSVSRLWGQSRQSVDTDQTVPPLASIGGEEVMLKGDIGLSMHVQCSGRGCTGEY